MNFPAINLHFHGISQLAMFDDTEGQSIFPMEGLSSQACGQVAQTRREGKGVVYGWDGQGGEKIVIS